MTDAPDLEPAALEAAHDAYEASQECQPREHSQALSEAIRAYLAAARSVPEAGKAVDAPTHRHLKTGHLVRVIGTGRMQMSTVPAQDMDDVVIYEHDGNLWVRAHWEFNDGRFASLPPSALASVPAPSGTEEQRTIACDEDNMPERIWAGDFDESGFGHCVAGMQGGLYAEYVRADLASVPPSGAEPELDTRILPETQAALDAIDENIRSAAMRAPTTFFGVPQAVPAEDVAANTSPELLQRLYRDALAEINNLNAEAISLRRKLEELRQAYESARYVPGDHPVVPVKIDAFMKVCARVLSEREGQE